MAYDPYSELYHYGVKGMRWGKEGLMAKYDPQSVGKALSSYDKYKRQKTAISLGRTSYDQSKRDTFSQAKKNLTVANNKYRDSESKSRMHGASYNDPRQQYGNVQMRGKNSWDGALVSNRSRTADYDRNGVASGVNRPFDSDKQNVSNAAKRKVTQAQNWITNKTGINVRNSDFARGVARTAGNVYEFGRSVADTMDRTVGAAARNAGRAVSGAVDSAKNWANGVGDSIRGGVDRAGKAVNGAVDSAKSWFGNLSNGIHSKVSELTGAATKAGKDFMGRVNTGISAAKATATKGFNDAKSWASNMFSGAGKAVNGAVDSAKNWANGVGDSIRGGVDRAGKAVNGAVDSAKNWAEGTPVGKKIKHEIVKRDIERRMNEKSGYSSGERPYSKGGSAKEDDRISAHDMYDRNRSRNTYSPGGSKKDTNTDRVAEARRSTGLKTFLKRTEGSFDPTATYRPEAYQPTSGTLYYTSRDRNYEGNTLDSRTGKYKARAQYSAGGSHRKKGWG